MIPNTAKSKYGTITRSTFDLKKDLKFQKLTSVTDLTVQNGEMLAAVTEKLLIHYSDGKGKRYQEMPLQIQFPDHVAHIHLSPTGFHAIVSSKLGHNFYTHLKSNTVHQLKKLRCQVTAVGWNPDYSKETNCTGPILLGTAQGSVIELNVGSTGLTTVLEELTPQVAQIVRKTSAPCSAAAITDIQLFQLDDDPKNKKSMVIIAQMERLIVLVSEKKPPPPPKFGRFTSSASLQAFRMNLGAEQTPVTTFHPFFSAANTQQHTISSKFSGKFKNHGFLTMHPLTSEPKRYAWLSSDGISIGKVDIFAKKIQDVLVEEFNIENRLIEGRLEPPTGISLTDHHILLAYSSRVLALSLLPPHRVTFEDKWAPEFGAAVGFCRDLVTEFAWLYTPSIAMKYGTEDDARSVWKTYRDRDDYAKALQIVRARKDIEPDAVEMVLRKQANSYIQENKSPMPEKNMSRNSKDHSERVSTAPTSSGPSSSSSPSNNNELDSAKAEVEAAKEALEALKKFTSRMKLKKDEICNTKAEFLKHAREAWQEAIKVVIQIAINVKTVVEKLPESKVKNVMKKELSHYVYILQSGLKADSKRFLTSVLKTIFDKNGTTQRTAPEVTLNTKALLILENVLATHSPSKAVRRNATTDNLVKWILMTKNTEKKYQDQLLIDIRYALFLSEAKTKMDTLRRSLQNETNWTEGNDNRRNARKLRIRKHEASADVDSDKKKVRFHASVLQKECTKTTETSVPLDKCSMSHQQLPPKKNPAPSASNLNSMSSVSSGVVRRDQNPNNTEGKTSRFVEELLKLLEEDRLIHWDEYGQSCFVFNSDKREVTLHFKLLFTLNLKQHGFEIQKLDDRTVIRHQMFHRSKPHLHTNIQVEKRNMKNEEYNSVASGMKKAKDADGFEKKGC